MVRAFAPPPNPPSSGCWGVRRELEIHTHRVKPHFKGRKETKQKVRSKPVYDASRSNIQNGGLERKWLPTFFCFRAITEIVVNFRLNRFARLDLN